MEKRISFTDFQSVKAVAKAINPTIIKRNKIKAQIEKLAEEYKKYDTQIKTLSAGITNVIGVDIEELVVKTMENGLSKYVPSSKVTYDAAKKEYIYNDGVANAEEPVAESSDDMQAEPEHTEAEVTEANPFED